MASKFDLLHFVGSIPLRDGEAVFEELSSAVGDYLRRMPDGETGERLRWIVFQQRLLTSHPAMEVDPDEPPLPVKQADSTVFREIRRLRMKADVDPERVDFDTTYDRAALESYKTFSRFEREGRIPAQTRFQFALPTPMASGLMYVSPNGRSRYLRAYEKALLKALTNILAGIPHDQLSIQFDVCQEVLLFENYFPEQGHDYKEQTFRQFARLAAAVPDDVELGFHLCYGSPNDQPLVRLEDASVLVELMNGIDEFIARSVAFIHIPVPRRAHSSFFAPMKRGTRPSAPRDQRTASTYIFGAVCPQEGKGAALILPACNTEAMNLHLVEIAQTVAPGAHAVLLADQAGWHLSTRLVVPPNITIIALPPKSPELNPVENVWQFMRDNWLSNRVFKSYGDLVDHCCEAWNKLVDQPWRIMSIGLRQCARVLISETWYNDSVDLFGAQLYR